MTNWQIQIHVVLTKNHASSEWCSQITTIIIFIQEEQNKESVGGKKIFKWYLWYAKYHTHYHFRETQVASIHFHVLRVIYAPYHGHVPFPHSCFGSHIYKYLLVHTRSVSVSTNFHPERPSFCHIRAASSLYLINCKMKSLQPQ